MTIELFYFDACPFCQDVMIVLQELNIKVEMRNIFANQDNLNRLISDTGRRTVPCLYVDNNPMFESIDINKWLRENKDKLTQKS
jgi:glutaredoxin 3